MTLNQAGRSELRPEGDKEQEQNANWGKDDYRPNVLILPQTGVMATKEKRTPSSTDFIYLTSRGKVGQVGTIDVDAQTGQLQITPSLIEDIEHRARRLVDRTTP